MKHSKIDLQKSDPCYYKASEHPQWVTLKPYPCLTISGQSAPEDQRFLDALSSIYPVAYGIKFLCKGEDYDFTVPKMEAYWFVKGGSEVQHLFSQTPRDEWMWKIAIRMPDLVDDNHRTRALANLRDKKQLNFSQVKLEYVDGGLFAHLLHVGSYKNEQESVSSLHAFILKNHHTIAGHHCEIYLNDPRRTAEEKLKTIIRYRVEPLQ